MALAETTAKEVGSMVDIRKLSAEGIVRGKSAWSAPALVVAVLFAANPAAAQECETDADCGFGFQCYSDTVIGTTTTGFSLPDDSGDSESGDDTVDGSGEGSSGSPTLVCGDNNCQSGETWEACPADCSRYTYCAGAVCEANSDCAEGYQCQAGGSNSSSGSSGGSVCGDGLCDVSETDNCDSDCATKCQQ